MSCRRDDPGELILVSSSCPVGVLVTFESKEMLLQREDFPAALRAL
jgi:hypothetical protein